MPDDLADIFADPPEGESDDSLDEDFSDALQPMPTDCPKCGSVDYNLVDEESCDIGQLVECTNCNWIWRVPL